MHSPLRTILVTFLVTFMVSFGHPLRAGEAGWTNPFATTRRGESRQASAPTPRTQRPTAPGVYLDRQAMGLGEAVLLTVIRPAGQAPAPLDIKALSEGFEVRDLNRGLVDNSAGAQALEQWTLQAYPRRLGRHNLPTWGLPGRAASVEVTDGSPAAPRVRLRLFSSTARLHERESALLTLEACSEGALQWQRPTLVSSDGALLRPLHPAPAPAPAAQAGATSDGPASLGGLHCTPTRWHWAMLPTAAGVLSVQPPMVQATRFGQVLRLPAPQAQFEVAAVPAWLPPEVAVGPLTIDVQAPNAGPVKVGEPWSLVLRVQGNLAPEALQQLLQTRLTHHPEWARYPFELSAATSPDARPAWTVTVHALAQQAGPLTWPALDWLWFDPKTEKLAVTRSAALRVDVNDPVRARTRLLAATTAGALFALFSAGALWRRQAWRWQRWRLTQTLHSVQSAAELRQRLLHFSLRPPQRGKPFKPAAKASTAPPATLGAWQQNLALHFHSADPSPWLLPLQRLLYANEAQAPTPIQPVVQQLRLWSTTWAPHSATPKRALGGKPGAVQP